MGLDLTGADAELLDPRKTLLGNAWQGRGVVDVETPYTLTRRQEHLYVFRVDIYEPIVLDVDDSQAAYDLAYPMKPTARGVPCWKRESQEENQPSSVGRTNYDIAMTIDQFTFPSGVVIDDGFLIKLYPLRAEVLVGAALDASVDLPMADNGVQFYIVQGGAQDRPAVGRRQANERKVFAVKTSPPKTVAGQLLAGSERG